MAKRYLKEDLNELTAEWEQWVNEVDWNTSQSEITEKLEYFLDKIDELIDQGSEDYDNLLYHITRWYTDNGVLDMFGTWNLDRTTLAEFQEWLIGQIEVMRIFYEHGWDDQARIIERDLKDNFNEDFLSYFADF